MKTALAFGLVLLASMATLVAVGGSARAADPCAIFLAVTPGSRVASISETQPSAVQFVGAYALEPRVATAPGTAHFTAVLSTGWVATISPASVAFETGEEVAGNITATIVVPAGELTTTVGRLTVSARAFLEGVTCTMAQATATVAPRLYRGPLVLSADRPYQEVTADAPPRPVAVTVNRSTNSPAPMVVRLHVDLPPGVSSDAPENLTLDLFDGGVLRGSAVINFTLATFETGVRVIRLWVIDQYAQPSPAGEAETPIFLRISASPWNLGVVAAGGAGAMALLGAVWWVWKRHNSPL